MKVQEEINGMGWWSDIEEEEKEQAQTNRIRRARERETFVPSVFRFLCWYLCTTTTILDYRIHSKWHLTTLELHETYSKKEKKRSTLRLASTG